MNGQAPGKDGLPGEYKMIDLKQIELFDLESDASETNNVAASNTKVVATIKKLADEMRTRLGDSLMGMEGLENRVPGIKD